MARLLAVLTPAGESSYVATFVVSRFLSAGVSAIGSIASFAVAGASNVGGYAALAAIFAFSGGMAGGWLSQAILRFGHLSQVSTLRLLWGAAHRGRQFTIASLALAGIMVLLRPTMDLSHQATTAGLVLVTSATFALLAIQQGRAMAQHHGLRVLINEFGRAASLTTPPLVVSLAWADSDMPYVWRCLLASLTIQLLTLAFGSLSALFHAGAEKDDVALFDSDAVVRYGVPLGLWIGLAAVYQNSDRVLLAWIASDKLAGEYSLVYDISSRGLLLPITALSGAASASVLRMFNRGDTQGATDANRSLVKTQLFLIIAMLPLVVFGAFIASKMLPWFGVHHIAVTSMTYLAAGVWTLADTIQRERLGAGHTLPLVRWLAAVAAAGVLANIVVIPMFGLVGASAVTLASSAAYAGLVVRDNHRRSLNEGLHARGGSKSAV